MWMDKQTDGWMDGQTNTTMLTGAFREYANAHNKAALVSNNDFYQSAIQREVSMLYIPYRERQDTSRTENSFVQSKFYFRTETFQKQAAPEGESGA
jgi:hypothetical protein